MNFKDPPSEKSGMTVHFKNPFEPKGPPAGPENLAGRKCYQDALMTSVKANE